MKEKYDNLGPMTFHELGIGGLFIICVVLWVFRAPGFIEGWSSYFSDTLVYFYLLT